MLIIALKWLIIAYFLAAFAISVLLNIENKLIERHYDLDKES